jgi:hypothetical protein
LIAARSNQSQHRLDSSRRDFTIHLRHVVEVLASILGRGQRKFPPAIENFWAGAKEAHGVVPSLHDWQAIGDLAITPSELDVYRTIRAFLRREAVQRIGIVGVRMEVLREGQALQAARRCICHSVAKFNKAEAVSTAERIRSAVEADNPGGTLQVTLTIGVVSSESAKKKAKS